MKSKNYCKMCGRPLSVFIEKRKTFFGYNYYCPPCAAVVDEKKRQKYLKY